jgi:hypothetical protein
MLYVSRGRSSNATVTTSKAARARDCTGRACVGLSGVSCDMVLVWVWLKALTRFSCGP